MPLAMRRLSWVWTLLIVLCSDLAVAQEGFPYNKVPRFPEFRGQTLADVVAEWTVFEGHEIQFSAAPDGELQKIVNPAQLRLPIAGNHKKFPPGQDLATDALIGVVVYPVKLLRLDEIAWFLLCLLFGMAFGWFMRGRWKRN
jgi:hypothetical protein